jgi:hypothetical protein
MADDYTIADNADDEVEFAIKMTAMLRTAARATDELAISYRELARRFAEQVDADLASDVDPIGLPITLAFREVYQQGQAILAALHERRTASDPTGVQRSAEGIELAARPTQCKRCPRLLVWVRNEAGEFVPLDPEPVPALAIAPNQRWVPERNVQGDNHPPRVRRAAEEIDGYVYSRHSYASQTVGEIVYFTMSRWDRGEDMGISYDKPYNVYIMEARLRSADRTVESSESTTNGCGPASVSWPPG